MIYELLEKKTKNKMRTSILLIFVFCLSLWFVPAITYGEDEINPKITIHLNEDYLPNKSFQYGTDVFISGSISGINSDKIKQITIEIRELYDGPIVLRDSIDVDSKGQFSYVLDSESTKDWNLFWSYVITLYVDDSEKQFDIGFFIPPNQIDYEKNPELMFDMPTRLHDISEGPPFTIKFYPSYSEFRTPNLVSLECNPSSGSLFHPGKYDITCKARNKDNETATRTMTIVVPDKPQQVPSWVKDLTKFWIKKQIDEQTYKNSLEYLIQKKIIAFPYIENDNHLRYVESPISVGTKTNLWTWANDAPYLLKIKENPDESFFVSLGFMIDRANIVPPTPSPYDHHTPKVNAIQKDDPNYPDYIQTRKALSHSTKPQGAGNLGDEHEHASLLVKIFGNKFDFSVSAFQIKSPWIHFEGKEGNTIHRHSSGVTLGFLFESMKIKINDQCYVFPDGREFCNDENYSLKFFINKKQVNSINDYVIRQGDRILVSYGAETNKEIEQQLEELDLQDLVFY